MNDEENEDRDLEENMQLSQEPDKWGFTPEDYLSVMNALDEEFVKQVFARSENSFTNILLGPYGGRLDTPAVLNGLLQQLALGLVSWAHLQGYAVLTDAALSEGLAEERADGIDLTEDEQATLDSMSAGEAPQMEFDFGDFGAVLEDGVASAKEARDAAEVHGDNVVPLFPEGKEDDES